MFIRDCKTHHKEADFKMDLWDHIQLSYLPFSFQNVFPPRKVNGILIAMVKLKWEKAMPSKNLTWLLLCPFIFQQANQTFPSLTIPQFIQVLWICCSSWEFGVYQRHKFTVAKGSKLQRAEGFVSVPRKPSPVPTFFDNFPFYSAPVWKVPNVKGLPSHDSHAGHTQPWLSRVDTKPDVLTGSVAEGEEREREVKAN